MNYSAAPKKGKYVYDLMRVIVTVEGVLFAGFLGEEQREDNIADTADSTDGNAGHKENEADLIYPLEAAAKGDNIEKSCHGG